MTEAQLLSAAMALYPPSWQSQLEGVLTRLGVQEYLHREIAATRSNFDFESVNNAYAVATAIRIISEICLRATPPFVFRAELELTHRCNLSCTYCKTRLKVGTLENAIDRQQVMDAICRYSTVGCKWIHFNGGEISLIDYVPEAVALAHSKGIRVSATSNGTGDIKFYERLVEAGIGDLHISFDTTDRSMFDKTSRIEGSWSRVRRTLEYLCRDARSVNQEIRVIANLTLHNDALRNLIDTIRFLVDLPVDDVKLQSSRTIEELPDELRNDFCTTLLPQLQSTIVGLKGFALLKARLSSLTRKAIQGSRHDPFRALFGSACEIQCQQHMLRKDGVIAPCFIYMRENYKRPNFALGDINSSLEEWKAKVVSENATRYLTDRTCQNYCPDFIADLNTSAKRLVTGVIDRALQNASERESSVIVGETSVRYSALSNVGLQCGSRCVLIPLWTPDLERSYSCSRLSVSKVIAPTSRAIIASTPKGTFDRLVADKIGYQFVVENGIRCVVDESRNGDEYPKVDVKATVLTRFMGSDGSRRTAILTLPSAIFIGGE
jgi:pyruvate-formate lyase-activating enzyme